MVKRHADAFMPAYVRQSVQKLKVAAPKLRLAHMPGGARDRALTGRKDVVRPPDDKLPALLVSFVYLRNWLKNQAAFLYRDWMLDSGAFSAFKSGVTIDIDEYIETCKNLLSEDPTLVEVVSLDVIGGNYKQGICNTERMWSAGVPAIPVYHIGEPWSVLEYYAKHSPGKIGVGKGNMPSGHAMKAFGQVFARVWPARVHGFGIFNERIVLSFPWHSVDATNWELQPCKYGSWKSFGGKRLSIRGSLQNIRGEVKHYLDLERKARARWRTEMALLEKECGPWPIRTFSDFQVKTQHNQRSQS